MRKSWANRRGRTIVAFASGLVFAWPTCAQMPAQTVKQAQLIAAQHPVVDCDLHLGAGVTVPKNAVATYISFHKALDGSLHDIKVYRSSGNPDLDSAALACEGARHNDLPSTQSGKPIEIDAIGAISWNEPRHSFVDHDPSSDRPHVCGYSPWLTLAFREGGQGGASLVSYHIAADGSVTDATITESAGNRYLDKASVECVSAWHFFPAMHNGVPVAIDEQSVINWRMK